jgi:hypothetical protein
VPVSSGPNSLAGLPLDYLIGADGPQHGTAGRVTETPFGEGPAANGPSIAYCNLRREDGEPPEFGPYLPHDDIFAEFREGRPDPQGPGFLRNIVEQLDNCKRLRHSLVEQDNPDSYPLSAVMHGIELAQERGLGVIAKNPGLMKDGAPTYVGHPNVFGIIVEKDCGTPAQMDALRRGVGKPGLPVWFVTFGDGRNAATQTAQTITAARFANMGVTYSREGEYESSDDVLVPIASPASVVPSFNAEGTGPDIRSKTQSPAGNPLLVLILVLAALSKERRISEASAKPGQGIDLFALLSPMLLQSALTGKQIDIAQLLTALLTDQMSAPAPAQPADKPATGSMAPAIQKPSVQISVAALAVSAILQAIGTIGTPLGMGTQPTTAGTLATLIPILTSAFGATGGFGSLLSFVRSLSSGLAGKARQPASGGAP